MGVPILAGLAGRAFAIAVVVAAVVATPVAIIQTVRLDGISLLGWQIVDGLKQEADKLRAENARLSQNAGAYRDGLATCDASVASLHSASVAATQLAQASLQAVRERDQKLEGEAAAILAARKPESDACVAADRLILGSVK